MDDFKVLKNLDEAMLWVLNEALHKLASNESKLSDRDIKDMWETATFYGFAMFDNWHEFEDLEINV